MALLVAVILLWPKTRRSNEITVAKAYEKFQQGAYILDVRTQAEWDQAHIANSTLIPLDQLQNRITEVPRDRDIVVVCHTGVRSRTGMNILQDAGYTRAVCMTGGLTAWKAAGYLLEGSSPESMPQHPGSNPIRILLFMNPNVTKVYTCQLTFVAADISLQRKCHIRQVLISNN